jgi:hypothetical protein
VRASWDGDAEIAAFAARGGRQHARPCIYRDGDIELHGALAWAEGGGLRSAIPRAGILLVHTAVGPHDLYLRWRAQALASRGYAVLIVDVFGDERGVAWEAASRQELLAELADDRPVIVRRMRLAMEALIHASERDEAAPRVCAERIAAIGCALVWALERSTHACARAHPAAAACRSSLPLVPPRLARRSRRSPRDAARRAPPPRVRLLWRTRGLRPAASRP